MYLALFSLWFFYTIWRRLIPRCAGHSQVRILDLVNFLSTYYTCKLLEIFSCFYLYVPSWAICVLPTKVSASAVFCPPQCLLMQRSAHHSVCFCSVLPTTVFAASAVFSPPQCLLMQRSAHHSGCFCGVLPSTVSASAVFCIPQCLLLQCPAHHSVCFCGVLPTKNRTPRISNSKNTPSSFSKSSVPNFFNFCSLFSFEMFWGLEEVVEKWSRILGIIFLYWWGWRGRIAPPPLLAGDYLPPPLTCSFHENFHKTQVGSKFYRVLI